MPPSILIAIPVFNEQDSVDRVLPRVLSFHPNILIVDDGSTDRTPQLLCKHPVEVIRHCSNRGYGRSVRDAFAFALCARFDWVITMDCDEQHEPAAIPAFIDRLRRDDLDLISGTRYPKREAPDPAPAHSTNHLNGNDIPHVPLPAPGSLPPPPDRLAINRTLTAELNARLAFNPPLTDSFCGFKAHRVAPLRQLALSEDGYAFPMQLWAQVAAHRLRVAELTVPLIYNNLARSFGVALDDPARRLAHYRAVLHRELLALADRLPPSATADLDPVLDPARAPAAAPWPCP